jgi:MFS family permease
MFYSRAGWSAATPSEGRGRLGTSDLTDARPQKAKFDWGRYGRYPVMMLALVAFIDSVDRQILPGVLSLVQDDLHISDSKAGVIGSVFIIMSFVATIPAGYLVDRFRRTRLIALVLAIWAVFTALNAAVVSYWQFLAVRAALGVGETANNPASSSLLADYYPPKLRGRAYSYQRAAPIFGTAVGLGVSGVIGALLGWRAAFLIVGIPGSIIAFWVLRLPEPRRGESDHPDDETEGAVLGEVAARRGVKALWPEIRCAIGVPSLRAVMVGSAISLGATAGFGFWAATFYKRHTSLGTGSSASLVGGIILIGAIGGAILGGRAAERARARAPSGPMRIAGISQAIAAVIFFFTFLHVPLPVRLVGQIFGVGFLIAAFPALAAMVSEVVPATIRGISFSMSGLLGALVSAVSPILIGTLADQFPIHAHHKLEGNLALAFAIVTPLIFVGAIVVLNGARHVESDIARVDDLAAELAARDR